MLRNAICLPSGDHDGDVSSVLPFVIIFWVFAATIEDADVRCTDLQVSGAILLEVVAIDHDRRRGLALPAVHLLRLVGRILIVSVNAMRVLSGDH